MRMHAVRMILSGAALALMTSVAPAQDFHGFTPTGFSGDMLASDALSAMVVDAMKASPPKNGDKYVLAFANLDRGISFCSKVEKGILANAEAAGIEVVVADNNLDGATALTNAESFINRDVDYVIEFQTDANFGATIMQKMEAAGIKVTAIDIPMPGSTFFGANNPKSGYMGGVYLGQAAIAKFGADKVKEGYFILGDLPQSGAVPAMRTGGQLAGFLAAVEGFPEDHVITIDTKNTLEESFAQTNNVLGRIPEGVPIMTTAINDQATTGTIRAVKQAGREDDLIAVGMGADELATMMAEPTFIASVGYFPERYGNFLVPMALSELAGNDLPPTVLMTHVMVDKGNVCEYYPDFECVDGAGLEIDFPQDAFEAHLAEIRKSPDMADALDLIPSE
ncbi:sugar ABC transporter substrate-binding protein [Bauldia litoralis]|uniref:Monosaccharide ABC transporter substrate-binding protein, CUT2 family (TC 3.A.1.2.-) n=1 Tax=Bauldia litoralis TaxID=665467 RepID=A0A1G6CSV7_9HYPH|nr:sugar ABC transporter substrate-binding protein [Bauldia litoralis]SDB35971.1 monosaccharide ABC transporter substrate-binding protein, CUT2 family (TC 3.A.1.2.-) [Bauldia litoralis]